MDYITHGKYADGRLFFDHVTKHRKAQKESFGPHSHDLFELIFFKRGDVSYTVGGQRYQLATHDLILTRPFDIHSIELEADTAYERYAFLFGGNVIPFDLHARISPDLHVVHFDKNNLLINLFDKMDLYCQKLEGAELGTMLKNLLQEVCVQLLLEAESAEKQRYAPTNLLVFNAISYIDQNLTTLTCIEEICSALYISKSHLHHLFHQHLQTTPKKFILTKRLALAQRELLNGKKPTDVYALCGFDDYATFYRAYRKYFGCTPSEKVNIERTVITHDNTLYRQ